MDKSSPSSSKSTGPATHHAETDEGTSSANSPTFAPRYTEFDIIQQNTQGSGKDLWKLETISEQCNDSKRNQIYLIQETKLTGKFMTEIKGCTFFNHGNDDKENKAGVGILLGKEAQKPGMI